MLTTAQAKAAHLNRIVESLLFLTRAGSEAGAPQRERLDLTAWLSSYAAQWTSHPRSGDIRFAWTEDRLSVMTHPVLLGEVVNVLLDNACRYSAPGSPIAVSLSHSEGSARLEVADQGQGIAPDDLPQVFTPFFRTTGSLRMNRQGVGLGLSIARRLAEALGGGLSVTSRVGCGSCFVVTLPTAAPAPRRERERKPAREKETEGVVLTRDSFRSDQPAVGPDVLPGDPPGVDDYLICC